MWFSIYLRDFWFCWHSFRSFLFLWNVALSSGWRACLFTFVGPLCFYYVFLHICIFVLFVCLFCFLLYCLSHHLKGRVHDSVPMRGHESVSTCRPGVFFFNPSGSLLFVWFFFRSIICFFSLALSTYFPVLCISLFFSQCIGVAGVCMLRRHSLAQWHGIVLLVYCSIT